MDGGPVSGLDLSQRGFDSNVPMYLVGAPRTTRRFCFGKSAQNHFRPGVALRVPSDARGLRRLRNSLPSNQRPLNVSPSELSADGFHFGV